MTENASTPKKPKRKQGGTAVTPASAPSVDRLTRSFNIIPGNPHAPLRDLVAIQIAGMDNRAEGGRLRIRGVVTCGSVDIAGRDNMYCVQLNHCFVDFHHSKMRIDPFHSFESYAQEAELVHKETAKAQTQKETSFGASASATQQVSSIKTKISGAFKKSNTQDSTTSAALTAKLQIAIIQDTSTGIRIGDVALGDVHKPNGALDGKYLHDRPDEPLCKFTIDSDTHTAEIEARVRVNTTSLRITRKDTSAIIPQGPSHRADAERALRETVAGLRYAKHLKQCFGTSVEDRIGLNNIHLATHGLRLELEDSQTPEE